MKHYITSEFWRRDSENMRPTMDRNDVADRLAAMEFPTIPEALDMVAARDEIVALLRGPVERAASDLALERLGSVLLYLPLTYDPARHGIIRQALAHTGWDYIPMTGAEKREWDGIVRTVFKGDAEKAATQWGHRHVLPRFEIMCRSGVSTENDASPSRQGRLRSAFDRCR